MVTWPCKFPTPSNNSEPTQVTMLSTQLLVLADLIQIINTIEHTHTVLGVDKGPRVSNILQIGLFAHRWLLVIQESQKALHPGGACLTRKTA